METNKENFKIVRCYECGSSNVSPCYDVENDKYGLMSCEECGTLNNEERFTLVVDSKMGSAIFNIVSQFDNVIPYLLLAIKKYCPIRIPNEWERYMEDIVNNLDTEDSDIDPIFYQYTELLFEGGKIIIDGDVYNLSDMRTAYMKMLLDFPIECNDLTTKIISTHIVKVYIHMLKEL